MKEWDQIEERFEKLIALGADKRTPEHERHAACCKAVDMISQRKVRGIAAGRWTAVARWVEWAKRVMDEAQEEVQHFVGRFSDKKCKYPFNLNGKNGWQCCQCHEFHDRLQMHPERGMFERYSENKCRCGHVMCGTYEDQRNWT